MQNLQKMLQNLDIAMLDVLQQVWQVNINSKNTDDIIEALSQPMLDPAKVDTQWQKLSDDQRGILQTLAGSGGKMNAKQFTAIYGDIRKMGKGQIEREQPHINPQSNTEALFYRGFIAEGFEKTNAGVRGVYYIPTDLIQALPLHQTTYDDLPEDEFTPVEVEPQLFPIDEEEVEHRYPANTSIVDDMTTLLAYLQLRTPALQEDNVNQQDREILIHFMLVPDETRLAFLIGIGVSLNLIMIQEGQLFVNRSGARSWLSSTRSQQVHSLVNAWRDSTIYRDLWHVDGLIVEDTGTSYDTVMTRSAIFNLMNQAVTEPQLWWSVDDFVMLMRDTNPNFQRPSGDYDDWYIRDRDGEYLRGYESWDAVEAALIEFYITKPMHWLGLTDLAEEAARLTAYGRAFLSQSDWPQPPEQTSPIELKEDGTIFASRRVSQVDRFQLARFTYWVQAGDPYVYKLSAEGLREAELQGINNDQITSFLLRVSEQNALPEVMQKILDSWRTGAVTEVTFQTLRVLRTTSPETMDAIYDEPAFRRYLGARLGETACVILAEDWKPLEDALSREGLRVEILS